MKAAFELKSSHVCEKRSKASRETTTKTPIKESTQLSLFSIRDVCLHEIYLAFYRLFPSFPGLSIKKRFCTAFDMEMVVILMQIKVISTRKVVRTALGLIWKVRVFVTRKWPIHVIHESALG